jgi:AcrR family transcriptional regulator
MPDPVTSRPDPATAFPSLRDERSARSRHLAIAAELVDKHFAGEAAPAHLVSHVRLAAVAERLEVGRSTLYGLWSSQAEFWHDLVLYCATRTTGTLVDVLDAPPLVESSGATTAGGLLDALATTIIEVERALVDDVMTILRTGLAGYPQIESINAPVAAAERRERARIARHVGSTLDALGRRPVPPLGVLDLATAIHLMIDGVVVYGRLDPSILTRRVRLAGDPTEWSLGGLAVRGLLVELSEKGSGLAPSALHDDGTFDDPADRLPDWSDRQLAALRAGRELVGEVIASPGAQDDALDRALGHLTLDRVARVSGVTRRQLYHLWPSQAEFRRDLLAHISADSTTDYRDRVSAAIDPTLLADPRRFVLHMVDTINAYRAEGEQRPAPHFALHPHIKQPDLTVLSVERASRGIGYHQGLVEGLLALSGLELRQGVTAYDLAFMLQAGAAASERLHRTDPGALTYGIPWRGGHHSIYAISVQALVDHLLAR